MKKVALVLIFNLIGIIAIAQNVEKEKRVKYITNAPDGSVAMVIYDDSRDDKMKLESANDFYKYEILDVKTSKPVYKSNNKGKECIIDKTKLADGAYNLRLYTKKFIITSKITIQGTRRFHKILKKEKLVAINR